MKGFEHYDYLRFMKENVVPLASQNAKKILERSYNLLSPEQKRYVNGIVLHKEDPAIIGEGQHQFVVRLDPIRVDNHDYLMCGKFSNAITECNWYHKSTIKDLLMLGGDLMALGRDPQLDCDYFLLNSLTGDQTNLIANQLRSLGIIVPFSQEVDIRVGKNPIRATITEDLSGGGDYTVYDAVAYIRKTQDFSLKEKLEDVIDDISKYTCIVGEEHLFKEGGL